MLASGSSPRPKRSLERDEDGRLRFQGCSSIREFEFLGKLGEGTFGEVYKARSKRAGSLVALKKILMHNEKDGFPITALREINFSRYYHTRTYTASEMAVNGAEVLLLLGRTLVSNTSLTTANLLINNAGVLQIADFGLARPYDEAPPVAGKGGGEAKREYTTLVVTRWYRPPELLLQLRRYTTAIDLWGAGCVFGEMFKGKPILAGTSDLNQAQLIFNLVGSPTEENMPGWSSLPGAEPIRSFGFKRPTLATVFHEQGPVAISLLTELLRLDWRKRINAIDALKHPYFTTPPLPAKPGDLPSFEDSHELDRRKFRGQKAALPPAPAGGSVGMGAHGEWTSGSSRGAPTTDPKKSRVPQAARSGYGNNMHPSSRPPYDSRMPDPVHGHKRKASGEPHSHLPAWQRDANLPPKPPAPANPQWQTGSRRGGGPGQDSRRDRPPIPRGGGGIGDGGRDSYVPNYVGGGNDRYRSGGDGPMPPRRDNIDPASRDRYWRPSRSRSPEMRDRSRSGDPGSLSHHLYRR
ncbi:CMGC/CDK protein kinase [Trichophyton equinum CBS 127.97]|uniref:CMGC/CDK protein kinase n=1 Tax=Trichophyton equinum (strain ATCC MYA-4606 / CBS 127.97) TaxID=559882 RepID=F2PQG6_TRIEC|nr:CMGC/CDK protein kinase [Trichophyton equinum CBS 127.97]